MITKNEDIQWFNNNTVANYTTVYYGLSTDTKPTENIANGSVFISMNTGKIYFYDFENATWLEWGAQNSV